MQSQPWNQLWHSLLNYSECKFQIQSAYDLLALKRCLNAHSVAPIVVKAVVQFYTESGVDEQSEDCDDFPLESNTAATILSLIHI